MLDSSIPYRIQRIYTSCTDKEKYYLRKILEEISETGDSQTYRDIWLTDYKEIPVDIDTFLCDDYYLGKTNRNGQAVYPYWKNFMQKLFYSGNKYEEVFFTGATRIGKSSTAITCTAYMLYKLMCLRDPQQYFGKKDVSVFSILFFNLTKELAAGVGYREFQDTVLASPWFLDNGKQAGSAKNPYYIPDGGKVTIDYGSDAMHGLGKQVFCLVGSTKIYTNSGVRRLDELNHSNCTSVLSYDTSDNSVSLKSYENVILSGYVQDTIQLELDDGTVIEGTEDHLLMLSDGSYKCLKDLQEGDDLMEVEIWKDIEGYEGYYEVSSFGRVRSKTRVIEKCRQGTWFNYCIPSQYIKQNSGSYPTVVLNKDHESKSFYVPYLVLKAFSCEEFSVPNFYHVDSNTNNNKLSNLRVGRRYLGDDWKVVDGTEGFVEVSKYGHVYIHSYIITDSIGRQTVSVEHEVNQNIDVDGYAYVDITKFPNLHFVHRIVASTFMPNSNLDNLQVNHIDGDKSNNSLDNLEWCTSQENILHAFRCNLRSYGSDIEKCKKMAEINSQSVRCLNNGKIYKSIAEAARCIGVSSEGLRLSILNNKPMRSGLQFVKCVES